MGGLIDGKRIASKAANKHKREQRLKQLANRKAKDRYNASATGKLDAALKKKRKRAVGEAKVAMDSYKHYPKLTKAIRSLKKKPKSYDPRKY